MLCVGWTLTSELWGNRQFETSQVPDRAPGTCFVSLRDSWKFNARSTQECEADPFFGIAGR
jgi:hypothetical protein